MNEKEIMDLMLEDHKKIVNLLNNVEKNNHPDIEAFCTFEWHLQKHIFIEEKAIYQYYKNFTESEQENQMFIRLSKEHTILLDLLDKITIESFPKGIINFNKLKKILNNHRKFEENDVYPHLEKHLNVSNKNEIIKKVKELIR